MKKFVHENDLLNNLAIRILLIICYILLIGFILWLSYEIYLFYGIILSIITLAISAFLCWNIYNSRNE